MRDFGETLSPLVLPIFKPTSVNSRAANRYSDIADAGIRFALITNSDNGAPAPSYGEVCATLDDRLSEYGNLVLPGFELRAGVSLGDLQAFSSSYSDRLTIVVHKGHVFSAMDVEGALSFDVLPIHAFVTPGTSAALQDGLPAAARILIRDGFAMQARNGDYPPESSFDDLVTQYRTEGFDGFGDFSTVGDRFTTGGGRANHVALHLTEFRDGEIVTNHFVSTSAGPVGDNTSKYFEALDLLVAYTGNPPRSPFTTIGARNFVQSAVDERFPGLGCAKRWSIMHHIALMESILAAAGASPVI